MEPTYLNALKSLDAVLRFGSFRDAAKALHVTPAAVGQQIRLLEEVLGRTLFDRTPHGVRALPDTRALAPRLSEAFRMLGGVMEDLRGPAVGHRLAITATTAITEGFLPGVLSEFIAREGAVDLRLDTSRSVVNLAEGRFDFAVRHMGEPGEGLGSIPLFPSLIAPVCAPDFARRFGLGAGTRTLGGVPLAQVALATSDPEMLDWGGWCARFDVAPGAEPQRLTGGASGVTLARAGLALVLSSPFDAFAALRTGELVLLPFGPERIAVSAYQYRLVWRGDRRLTPLQRRFRDQVAERAEMVRRAVDDWLASGAGGR